MRLPPVSTSHFNVVCSYITSSFPEPPDFSFCADSDASIPPVNCLNARLHETCGARFRYCAVVRLAAHPGRADFSNEISRRQTNYSSRHHCQALADVPRTQKLNPHPLTEFWGKIRREKKKKEKRILFSIVYSTQSLFSKEKWHSVSNKIMIKIHKRLTKNAFFKNETVQHNLQTFRINSFVWSTETQ